MAYFPVLQSAKKGAKTSVAKPTAPKPLRSGPTNPAVSMMGKALRFGKKTS